MLRKIISCKLVAIAALQACNTQSESYNMIASKNTEIPLATSNIPSGQTNRLNYSPVGIVLGKMGRGKTSLFNMLCKQNFDSSHSGGSVTQHLCKKPVAFGGYNFELVDTAGLKTLTDVHKHAYLVMTALNEVTFNTIFLVLRYHERFDEVFQELSEVIEPVENYTEKVVFMISHWDEAYKANKHKEAQNYIPKLLGERGYKNPIIYYSGDKNNSSPAFDVANAMYKTMTYMQPGKCNISLRDFHMKFDISENARGKMHRDFKKFEKNIDQLLTDYLKLVLKYKDEPDSDEIIHFLLTDYNSELNKIEDEIIKKYGDAMNEFEDYAFYIEVKAKCVKNGQKFAEETSRYAKWGEAGSALLSIFRKCPHCGLVWSKLPASHKNSSGSWIEGCDGEVNCGNRFGKGNKDYMNVVTPKYRVLRDNQNVPVTVERTDMKVERKKEFVEEFSSNNTPNRYALHREANMRGTNYIEEGGYKVSKPFDVNRFSSRSQYANESSPQMTMQMPSLKKVDHYLPESAFRATKEIFRNNYNEKGEKKYDREYGCGKAFVWKNAPILSGKELQSLLQFMTPDVIEFIISKEKYQELRTKVMGYNFGTNQDERIKAIWKE